MSFNFKFFLHDCSLFDKKHTKICLLTTENPYIQSRPRSSQKIETNHSFNLCFVLFIHHHCQRPKLLQQGNVLYMNSIH